MRTPIRLTVTDCGCALTASGARMRLRMTASTINRMLPGSLAERHDAHQRRGLDEQRGVRDYQRTTRPKDGTVRDRGPARAIRSPGPPAAIPSAGSSALTS